MMENPQFEIVKSSDVTEALTRAEIDVQISTAKKYPRDITKFQRSAISLVTQDPDTAAACFYSLPRGRGENAKTISGESVRLAEIAASCFGNLRVYGRITAIEEKWVVAQGLAHDLENNVCYAAEVRRRITDRNGARYNDDMIIVTTNAAIAIATRNATMKAVPRALLKPVIAAAEKIIRGDESTLPQRREEAVKWFEGRGIKRESLYAYIGVGGMPSIDLDRLVQLAGLKTRVEEEGAEAIAEINAGAPADKNIFQTEKTAKKPEAPPVATTGQPTQAAKPAENAPSAATSATTDGSGAVPKAEETGKSTSTTRDEAVAALTLVWPKLNVEQKGEALDGISLPKGREDLLVKVLKLPDADIATVLARAQVAVTPQPEAPAATLKELWEASTEPERLSVKSGTGATATTLAAFEALKGEDMADCLRIFKKLAAKRGAK